ncbi:hypothetical protein [Campylobacter hyointestinalis]|uniref:hypothetical protein n=1 Tax=Campylobacter hyointestinalis TaxID=198 RepID=UPI000CE350B0|nr:hypothetical protein [Campylobacter hyointestinalis]PPB51644.1 hypothetical protein CDQ67_10130 [Campylobacter hyointestinalis subsp. hyointestinalis]
MSKVIKRLETAIEKIEQIEKICNLKEVQKALEDELILKPAIMKHFDVIYQQFKKINDDQEYKILSKFDKDELRGLSEFKKWSLCDCDNIENEIIEDTMRNDLPNFKKNIQKVLQETKKELCKDLEKKVDYFTKKQDILMPEAKTDLAKTIEKEYKRLQESGVELDKSYSDKIKNIIKEN